jgi:HSP20 family protein
MLRNRFAPAWSEQSVYGTWNDLHREIDRLFESALSGTFMGSQWLPAMDVEENADGLRLTFEVPGIDAKDLHVTVENGVLTVSGEKRSEAQGQNGGNETRSFERRYGRFERSVTLPQTVDAEKISARCENGLLIVELAKRAEARPRTIEIRSGEQPKQIKSRNAA